MTPRTTRNQNPANPFINQKNLMPNWRLFWLILMCLLWGVFLPCLPVVPLSAVDIPFSGSSSYFSLNYLFALLRQACYLLQKMKATNISSETSLVLFQFPFLFIPLVLFHFSLFPSLSLSNLSLGTGNVDLHICASNCIVYVKEGNKCTCVIILSHSLPLVAASVLLYPYLFHPNLHRVTVHTCSVWVRP